MRLTLALAGFLTLGLLLGPSVGHVAAAGDKAAEHGKADSHGDGHSKGFQLIPEKADLGIWSLVLFLLLLAGLWKVAWKPMVKTLQEREHTILSALEEAEKTRRQTLELQASIQVKMNEASQRVAAVLEEAHRDATALKDQMIAEARAEQQRDRERLLREIETAKDQALKEIWEQSVTLASELSMKTIRRQLSVEDHRRLLDETLVDLKAAGLSASKRI